MSEPKCQYCGDNENLACAICERTVPMEKCEGAIRGDGQFIYVDRKSFLDAFEKLKENKPSTN